MLSKRQPSKSKSNCRNCNRSTNGFYGSQLICKMSKMGLHAIKGKRWTFKFLRPWILATIKQRRLIYPQLSTFSSRSKKRQRLKNLILKQFCTNRLRHPRFTHLKKKVHPKPVKLTRSSKKHKISVRKALWLFGKSRLLLTTKHLKQYRTCQTWFKKSSLWYDSMHHTTSRCKRLLGLCNSAKLSAQKPCLQPNSLKLTRLSNQCTFSINKSSNSLQCSKEYSNKTTLRSGCLDQACPHSHFRYWCSKLEWFLHHPLKQW